MSDLSVAKVLLPEGGMRCERRGVKKETPQAPPQGRTLASDELLATMCVLSVSNGPQVQVDRERTEAAE